MIAANDSPPRPSRRSGVREFVSAVGTIMVKELRSRMRGRRAFLVLTLYLGILALITYGVYVVVGPEAQNVVGVDPRFGLAQANASARIGQSIFAVLSIFQIIMVSMIAPAFTSGQISLEREKQTLDLLITTPLRPGAIVVGKLLTALAFVVLMIVSAIPICAIVLMYGGATVGDIARQQVLLLAVAIGFGAVGIFASALMRRTQAATVLAYCVVLTLTLGSAMVYAFWNQVARNDDPFNIGGEPAAPEVLRYLNPMVGMLDIVSAVEVTGPSRFTEALYEQFGPDLSPSNFVDVGDCDGGIGCPAIPRGPDEASDAQSGYWWPRVAVGFLVLAVVLTIASMRLVVPAGLRNPFRRRSVLQEPAPAGSPAIEELTEAEP